MFLSALRGHSPKRSDGGGQERSTLRLHKKSHLLQ
jgi:hypothetical protein